MRYILAIAMACVVPTVIHTPAQATASRGYKAGEYVVIDGGRAPNRRLAIAAHGDGDEGFDGFHLSLMRSRRPVTQLPAIESDNILYTAAKAFRAEWSPDSRYVAVLFHANRHARALRLYRTTKSAVLPIEVPDPVDAVIATAKINSDNYDLRTRWIELTWLGPARFRLRQRSMFTTASHDFERLLGSFARDDGSRDSSFFVDVAVDAVYELGKDGHARIVKNAPGSFD